MKKSDHSSEQQALSDALISKIATSITPTVLEKATLDRIKTKIMNKVKDNRYEFVFSSLLDWQPIAPGVEMKLLHKSTEKKSFMLKMSPHSSIAEHIHDLDEESFVLEGEVWLEGILCHTGDFHYAQAGSHHKSLHTETGCILLVNNS
ncbi:MAG: cupin domain-containing protein [Methylophilus sp.]